MDAVTRSVGNTIRRGQAVVVSYDRSDAGSEALGVSSNTLNVADFTTGRDGVPAVVNNSEVDRSPPALTGAMVTSSGVAIELAFDEDLDLPAIIPAALKGCLLGHRRRRHGGDFGPRGGRHSSGLQINLSSRILKDQAVVVSYDQSAAGTNALDDDAGNEVVDFTTGSGGVPAVENDSTELSDDATLRGLSMSVQNDDLATCVGGCRPVPGVRSRNRRCTACRWRTAKFRRSRSCQPRTIADATVAYFDGDDMALADAGAGSSAVDEGHQGEHGGGPEHRQGEGDGAGRDDAEDLHRDRDPRVAPRSHAATVPAGGTPVVLQLGKQTSPPAQGRCRPRRSRPSRSPPTASNAR